ncbi:MAG: hypothetical protein ACTS27_11750, partial [Phycisphaerales bacterium]
MLALLATVAAAQPGGADLSSLAPGNRIDAARERVRDESLTGAERLDALRSLIDALDARLSMEDVPAETKMRDAVELSESLLSFASWQGLQTTASAGILTPGMRRETTTLAVKALVTMRVFDALAERDRAPDDALRARAALAKARAGMMLHASAAPQLQREAGLEAAESIRGLPTLLRAREASIDGGAASENAEAEAQRLVLLGLLALQSGRAEEARERLQAAREVAMANRTKAEAALTAAFATRAIDGPRRAYDELASLGDDPAFAEIERTDPLVRILRADAMRRVALADAEFATGEDLERAARDARAPYLALAEQGVEGIDTLALRGLLMDKAAISGDALRARLGNDASDGAFERLAVASIGVDTDALRSAVEGIGPDDRAAGFRADAMWRLATLLVQRQGDAEAQREAAQTALRFADEYPDDPRTGSMLSLGASAGQRHSALAGESPASLGLYEDALRANLEHVERTGKRSAREDSLRFEFGRVLALQGENDRAAEQLARVAEGDLGLRAAELLLSLAQRSGDEARVSEAADLVRRRARGVLEQGEDQGARRALERAGAVGLAADLRAAVARGDADAASSAATGIVESDAPGGESVVRDEAVSIVEQLAALERERGDLNETKRSMARVAVAIAAPLADAEGALDGDRVLLARARRQTG